MRTVVTGLLCVLTVSLAVGCGDDDYQGNVDGAVQADAVTQRDGATASDGSTDGAVEPDAAPQPMDCTLLVQAGYEICEATPDTCETVFYNSEGCVATCASAGMECVASFRDDDETVPQCARHPSLEAYACAETGHQSDYCVCGERERAFDGAEGFGAYSVGGRGGTVFTVTNLDDSGTGSLRWAVERNEPRIVEFAVDGIIRLESALDISDPYITIDGRGALGPGQDGITIRDYPIDIRTHDVIIRYLNVRLGDWAVLKRNDDNGWTRPANSNDLDCINIHQSENVILDHLSMSWSTDEIVSITNSRNITIQWSILSEPIANPATHPYGDNHAYCANNSAATLTYHHNLFAHYVMRGPQFEANDMQRESTPFDAKFEAVNNVMYAYTSSGSRYRTGFENAADRVTSVDFMYHFVGNRYVNASSGDSEIMAHDAYGVESNILVYFLANLGPHRPTDTGDERSLVFTDQNANDPLIGQSANSQVSTTPLFVSPLPVTTQPTDQAYQLVLDQAGCFLAVRNPIDARIIDDVQNVRPANIIFSQEDVPGGWPTYP